MLRTILSHSLHDSFPKYTTLSSSFVRSSSSFFPKFNTFNSNRYRRTVRFLFTAVSCRRSTDQLAYPSTLSSYLSNSAAVRSYSSFSSSSSSFPFPPSSWTSSRFRLNSSSVVRRTMASTTTAPISSSSSTLPTFETVSLTTPEEGILTITLNRPTKMNAMNKRMWKEIEDSFVYAGEDKRVRVVLLTGEGNHFTSGLDLQDHLDLFTPSNNESENDVARKAFALRKHIKDYQRNIGSVEDCPKPVIALVHGACIGGGVDLIATADIRIATSDAFFSIKEAEIGLAADVGTLQRLPKIIGNGSILRELVYTARRFSAEEALRFGMLSNVYPDRSSALQQALSIARKISQLSPVAIQGSKINLNFSRDHPVSTGLEYQAVWNMGMLQTNDIPTAATATMTKTLPVFPKL